MGVMKRGEVKREENQTMRASLVSHRGVSFCCEPSDSVNSCVSWFDRQLVFSNRILPNIAMRLA